jgi:hypothetical protein
MKITVSPLELRVKLDVGIAGLMHALNPQGKYGQLYQKE